jgi:hypothetical protein
MASCAVTPKFESSDKSVVVPASSRPPRKTLDLFSVATPQDDVFGLKGRG